METSDGRLGLEKWLGFTFPPEVSEYLERSGTMARIRTIKPDFWKHEQLGKASAMARLTFAGLISLADDEGRGRANPESLWGELHAFQGSGPKAQWKRILTELEALKDDDGPLVVFYQVAGASFYWLPGFCRQQYIERPSQSKLPAPPISGNDPLQVGEASALEGKGREGIGREGRALPELASPEASEDQEIRETVSRYGGWLHPGQYKKTEAVIELRSMGLSHEFIRNGAQVNKPADVGFWDIVKALKANGSKPAKVVSDPPPPPPPREKPPVLREPTPVAQKRIDDAKAKAREKLQTVSPETLESWKAEGQKTLAGVPEYMRVSALESFLLTKVAKEFGIVGL